MKLSRKPNISYREVIIVALGVVAVAFFRFADRSLAQLSPVFEYHADAAVSPGTTPPEPEPPHHVATPPAVRAIYMSSWVAGTKDWREKLVAFMDESEVNAVVIDVKDYSGKISFDTDDPIIDEMGAEEVRIRDAKEFIAELHKHDIYVIGRISSFQDPVFVAHRPQFAIKRKNGSIWKDRKGIAWVDPYSRAAWDYLVRVGKAAERVGFDELNYDYVRYPTDGDMNNIVYPLSDGAKDKSDVIAEYFAYLDKELADTPVPISVDLFGLTTTRMDDMNIGQILEKAAPHVDFIARMVYPSHYPNGYDGYQNPAKYPYEIILQAMKKAADRLVAASSSPDKLRPWLQDFDLGATYDASMIKKQKQAVYDAGLGSWMMWDPKNLYTRDGYEKAPASAAAN